MYPKFQQMREQKKIKNKKCEEIKEKGRISYNYVLKWLTTRGHLGHERLMVGRKLTIW